MITVGIGRTVPTSTCTFPDRLDSCGPAGRQEVVFRFVAPMSAGYTIAARNPGTANVSNSTQFIDGATCMPIAGCAGLIGRRYSTRGVRHSATFLAEPQQQGSSLPT